MFEAVGTAVGMATGGANSLWHYNRENYFLNRQLKQNRAHQIQNMRVTKAGLYREDLRDVFGLTVQKLDSYLVINTLQMGFAISLFYDGKFFSLT